MGLLQTASGIFGGQAVMEVWMSRIWRFWRIIEPQFDIVLIQPLLRIIHYVPHSFLRRQWYLNRLEDMVHHHSITMIPKKIFCTGLHPSLASAGWRWLQRLGDFQNATSSPDQSFRELTTFGMRLLRRYSRFTASIFDFFTRLSDAKNCMLLENTCLSNIPSSCALLQLLLWNTIKGCTSDGANVLKT